MVVVDRVKGAATRFRRGLRGKDGVYRDGDGKAR